MGTIQYDGDSARIFKCFLEVLKKEGSSVGKSASGATSAASRSGRTSRRVDSESAGKTQVEPCFAARSRMASSPVDRLMGEEACRRGCRGATVASRRRRSGGPQEERYLEPRTSQPHQAVSSPLPVEPGFGEAAQVCFSFGGLDSFRTVAVETDFREKSTMVPVSDFRPLIIWRGKPR
jgi:hypothetical protein